MVTRYWEFESREITVPETQLQAVRERLTPLIPTTFCEEAIFRCDGYPDDLVACVLDAIGSVGVRYKNVIRGLEKFRKYSIENFGRVPTTPNDFLRDFSPFANSPGSLAGVIWSRHRTSSRGGTLKIEAMFRWMQILNRYQIQTPHQLLLQIDSRGLKEDLLATPGQTRYVSLIYFFMLAGYKNGVKVDRMIQKWFKKECGLTIDAAPKAVILMKIAEELSDEFPCISAAELDHFIWLIVSNRWSPKKSVKKIFPTDAQLAPPS